MVASKQNIQAGEEIRIPVIDSASEVEISDTAYYSQLQWMWTIVHSR